MIRNQACLLSFSMNIFSYLSIPKPFLYLTLFTKASGAIHGSQKCSEFEHFGAKNLIKWIEKPRGYEKPIVMKSISLYKNYRTKFMQKDRFLSSTCQLTPSEGRGGGRISDVLGIKSWTPFPTTASQDVEATWVGPWPRGKRFSGIPFARAGSVGGAYFLKVISMLQISGCR